MFTPQHLLHSVRAKVVSSTVELFSHGPTPLEHTLSYKGDPGLLGPESVSWRIVGDVTAFVGGIRALIIQTAHPEVVAGVEQHSKYREDPLGRLSRTSVYVTETTYGAMPEVEQAVAAVRQAHKPVTGKSERGRPYSANSPEMAAWVHNVLTDSFLVAYQYYGPDKLDDKQADLFVIEQSKIGALLKADPMPQSSKELSEWIVNNESLDKSKAQQDALRFLLHPPLSVPVRLGYKLLCEAALATIPQTLLSKLGMEGERGSERGGRLAVSALRWALRSSPAWELALTRCDSSIEPGKFRQ